jgi:hypothetical protein
MHKTLLMAGLLLAVVSLQGQDSVPVHESEFYVSGNRTILKNENTNGRFGFGAGVLFVAHAQQRINIVAGLEYNRTSQFKKYMYNGRYSSLTDVTYHLNFITLPLAMRINIGKQKRFFVEPGLFGDLVISPKMEGTQTSYSYEEGSFGSQTSEISRGADVSSAFGLSFGLGVRVPAGNMVLILRPDVKVAINTLYDYQETITNRYVRLNVGIKF